MMKCLQCCSLMLVAALFGACATSSTSRIQEKNEVYRALSPEQQKMIAAGGIEVGYTADMVYIALGKPSTVRKAAASDDAAELWTYQNYYPTEAISGESIYRKPTVKSGPRQSGSLSAWGDSSLPSDGGVHGDMINTPNRGPSGGGAPSGPDIAPVTLEVVLHAGRVTGFTINR
jgi:hypothetical protein